ncbi:hypothetical protein AAZX31_17G167500 [Glycine max]
MKWQIMSYKIRCRDLPCFCILLNGFHPIYSSYNGCDFYVGHLQAAKEARHDKEALVKFFCMLIRRRYFSDEIQIPSPAWSIPSVQRQAQRIDENFTEDDQSYNTSNTSHSLCLLF